MSDTETDLDIRYAVVVNDEEQYSIWPVDRPRPAGWHAQGTVGSRQECLDRIAEVWTDMRPRSVRDREQPGRPAGSAGEGVQK